MARCPAHDDSRPSLSICDADGKVLVHCYAGCGQEQVIAALRTHGLWTKNGPRSFAARPAPQRNEDDRRSEADRSEAALYIWRSAKAAVGTLVPVYLASRNLHSTRKSKAPPRRRVRIAQPPQGMNFNDMLVRFVLGPATQ
jgi:hypothetical protein